MKTLHKYLTLQVLASLLLAVAVFTFVLLLGTVLKEILLLLVNGQARIGTVLEAIGLLIPFICIYALPMGLLTSTLLVFGRFSADQELTAARASGVSLLSLVAPVLLLSLFCCGVSAWFNMDLGPRSRVAYKNLISRARADLMNAQLPADQPIYDFPGYIFLVGENRGGDLKDVLAAADWIKQTGYVDPKKLILMGGSYGGYLTMMGVTKAPEVWAAGAPIVPFVNWFTEIQNEDPVLQQSDLATMGDLVKNKALYEDRSPINFVDQIKAPLYLLAGGNDPRCPKEEAQQVVDAVKKRGGVAEYKVYENEGHGFARVENQIDAYKRVADFLKAHVPPADCSCSLNE